MICSLALARLRTDIRGSDLANSNAVGMAQKLLLFWRKPARRCWWEGVELDGVEGVEGKLKVWIRRVWTLEMVSFLLFESTFFWRLLLWGCFVSRENGLFADTMCFFASLQSVIGLR